MEAACLAVESPWPDASTPISRTLSSFRNGWKMPMALEPPPMQATTASGSRPSSSATWALVSSPITAWKSRTMAG